MKSQGAPRTCRCIETCGLPVSVWLHEVREHHAPVGALRHRPAHVEGETTNVREHHAPVGALRQGASPMSAASHCVREHHAPVGALRRQSSQRDDTIPHSSGSTTHL